MEEPVDRVGSIEFIAVGRLTMGRMGFMGQRPVSQGEDSGLCATRALAGSELTHHPVHHKYRFYDVSS